MPAEVPVGQRGQHFDRIKLELKGLDQAGRELSLPSSFTAEAVVKPPQQLDPEVESIIDSTDDHIEEDLGHLRAWLETRSGFEWFMAVGHKKAAAFDSIYAARYHQRQFFARLRIVTSEQLFATEPVGGRNKILLFDLPLRSELESFLLRTKGLLDALAKAATFTLGKRSRTHGSFQKFLEKDTELSEEVRSRLRRAYRGGESWITQVGEIRNAILHDGQFDGFTPIAHIAGKVVDAEVVGINAGAFVLKTWIGIRALVPAVIRASLQGAVVPPRA